jgi:hypothetical protein
MADAFRKIVVDRCRQRRDQPARVGGAGRRAVRLAEQQPHDAVLGSAERQPAAGSEIEQARVAAYLGEHGGETATAQSLLEYPEGVLRFRHAHDDYARRVEAEAGEPGAIGEAGLAHGGGFDDPQDRASILDGQAREHRYGEAGHGGGIATLIAMHLVECGAA